LYLIFENFLEKTIFDLLGISRSKTCIQMRKEISACLQVQLCIIQRRTILRNNAVCRYITAAYAGTIPFGVYCDYVRLIAQPGILSLSVK
jgi:hypothetical protein